MILLVKEKETNMRRLASMIKNLATILITLTLLSCGPKKAIQRNILYDQDPLCKFKLGRSSSKTVEDIFEGSLFNFGSSIRIEVPYRVPKLKDLPKGSLVYICSYI
jgi:hypothetical protein